ncbi:Glycosyl hydrolases family 2 [Pustulibacterium marinum]|uniref:Glycosyl hydrolases family 2 n=1 Tax=Pustulibacterium marinum TaxID=1224947 RepID=A0A1I7H0H6_9FLAO|nr:sugar-binding domain-containing protein [Pustulibacterium marinum]SFU54177.1 Glycosyl hydrolases family 2 [Pustulibacterium marinum]
MKNKLIIVLVLITLFTVQAQEVLKTPWTDQVEKEHPLNEYPRPQLQRDNWTNLNGSWAYAITNIQKEIPTTWDGEIVVPFPVESYLSGVQKRVTHEQLLWYKRNLEFQTANENEKVILHFGAVDYETEVYINGFFVGNHKGGYTAFEMDVTSFLKQGANDLVVKVHDPTMEGEQARGKQVKNPGGIYYTPVTGIWKTVWLENVPESYIKSNKITTGIDKSVVSIQTSIVNAKANDQLELKVFLDDKEVTTLSANSFETLEATINNAQLWTPDTPTLYTYSLAIIRDHKIVDKVEGYFGMRDIRIAKDDKGVQRLMLNHKPLFQYGPLDQGYWPDGIYTAPTEEALLWDIQQMKAMGFNMVRKHVKVEPERWYYHCDRIGLIVWQDMPSGYNEIVPVKDHDHSVEATWLDEHYNDLERSFDSENNYRTELKEMMSQLHNYPSICVWVPFNESWGQFKTNEILDYAESLDPSRVIDGPSGWIDRNGGELHDFHLYGNRLQKEFPLEDHRGLVIGEFGGLGYGVKDHVFSKEAWSYQGFKNEKQLKKAYQSLINRIVELKAAGFSAAVYTQLTDVETEINGLITYDRKVIKIAIEDLKELHKVLYLD